MGISEYHSGCIHVKILGKLFSIPCGRKFYTLFFGMGFRGKFIMFKCWVLFICSIGF